MGYVAWGFDYAYGNGLTIATLQANECNFVCRYLSGTPGAGKDVSKLEIEGLLAAGIKVVLNWETTGQMPSQAQGVADAKAAQAEAEALSYPDAVIYFSADFNPNGYTTEINAYMTGVASVLGKNRTGLYAGYAGVEAYLNAGIGDYAWQTYAWSNNQWDIRAQLQQYANTVTIGPASVDRDRATVADYGYCTQAVVPPAAPEPWPAPTGLAADVANTFATSGYQTGKLSWDAVPGATSYQGEISTGNSTTLAFQTSGASVEGVSLTWNTTYEFHVQCHPTSDRPEVAVSIPFHFTTPQA